MAGLTYILSNAFLGARFFESFQKYENWVYKMCNAVRTILEEVNHTQAPQTRIAALYVESYANLVYHMYA